MFILFYISIDLIHWSDELPIPRNYFLEQVKGKENLLFIFFFFSSPCLKLFWLRNEGAHGILCMLTDRIDDELLEHAGFFFFLKTI